jgi:hypothetical protein
MKVSKRSVMAGLAAIPTGLVMRELQHLILHGLVSAFVRAKPYTLLSLLKAAFPNQAR